jgi:pimeloyl-ACP methyl ester carboxylesterase
MSEIFCPNQFSAGYTIDMFGFDFRQGQVTSTRFADALTSGIANSEMVVFEGCAHAPIYEKIPDFNENTLHFLTSHIG